MASVDDMYAVEVVRYDTDLLAPCSSLKTIAGVQSCIPVLEKKLKPGCLTKRHCAASAFAVTP